MASINPNYSMMPPQASKQGGLYSTADVVAGPGFMPAQALQQAQQTNIPVVIHHPDSPNKEIVMPSGDSFVIKGNP